MTTYERVGRVEAVFIGQTPGTHLTTQVSKIRAVVGQGIKGDLHAGARFADAREEELLEFGLPKDIEIANHRHFSAVSRQEVQTIAKNMGLSGPVPLGCFGENIVFDGLESLSQLPSRTLLLFKNGERVCTAVLAVWGYNPPCNITGVEVLRAYKLTQPPTKQSFKKAAEGLRGIVGTVYCSGIIREGDTVFAIVPKR